MIYEQKCEAWKQQKAFVLDIKQWQRVEKKIPKVGWKNVR